MTLGIEKMLVAFLKTDSDIKASIIKFEDRIWILESGDADVLRRFWVKVEEGSNPISMIRCFISQKIANDIEPLCEHSDSRDYPFNDRERYTGIVDIVKGRAENTIDGIRYHIRKIDKQSVELAEVGEGLSLDINFSKAPLNPGLTYIVPIKFTIKNLVDLTPVQTLGETHFKLCYFIHPNIPDMYLCIEENMTIPVVPILPGEDGGFAVFLYPPPAYQITSSIPDSVDAPVNYDYQGNSIDLRSGIFVELCDIMKRQSIEPVREQIVFSHKRFNHHLEVTGKIIERVYPSEIRNQISELRKKIGKPNKYTWIAIGLAAAGLIVALVSIFT